jgi:hypothetical protein
MSVQLSAVSNYSLTAVRKGVGKYKDLKRKYAA